MLFAVFRANWTIWNTTGKNKSKSRNLKKILKISYIQNIYIHVTAANVTTLLIYLENLQTHLSRAASGDFF